MSKTLSMQTKSSIMDIEEINEGRRKMEQSMEKIKNIYAVYFSPTGGTKKGAETLAKAIGDILKMPYKTIDVTLPQNRLDVLSFGLGDLVVFGMPVIAGRVPNLLLPYLQERICGNGALGVPVVSFGNRNFDDALVEMRNLMEVAGFRTVAGGAFVSEHSFSKTLGAGRPNVEDVEEIKVFGQKIVGKMASDWTYEEAVWVAGNNPPAPYYTPRDRHGKHIDIRKVKPKTEDGCTKCGVCVEVCPLGSIEPQNPSIISGICMKCCACVKKCPEQKKYFEDAGYLYHKEELEEMYARPAKMAYFL